MKISARLLSSTILLAGLAVTALPAAGAESPAAPAPVEFTDNYGALFYYKTTHEALDVAAAAAQAKSVQMASPFDKAKRQADEEARIRKGLEDASSDRLLTVNVATTISAYDPSDKGFTVELFEPGRYLPFSGYGHPFQLVFENSDSFRTLQLPESEARKVNDKSYPRSVTAKVDFRLTGAGDPSGATAATNTVSATITRVRYFDGSKLLLPEIIASAPVANGPAKAPGDWVIQGLHLGMTKAAFESAAKAAYGGSVRFELGREAICGFADWMIQQGNEVPQPGTVCVTYQTEGSDIVRQFTVKQVLTIGADYNDALRKPLVEKFGPIAFRDQDGGFGWGDLVGGKMAKNFTVYARTYGYRTSYQYTSGTSGLPVLQITVTDPDFARAHLPTAAPKPPAATTGPKL